MKITILGSGGWGTALANLLSNNGHTVTLWSFLAEECENLKKTRENPFLKGIALHPNIAFTNDLDSVSGAEMVVFATRLRMSRTCYPQTAFWFLSPRVLRLGLLCVCLKLFLL